MERGGEDGKLGVRPALELLDGGRDDGKFLEGEAGALGEAVVDKVDVADGVAAHHERHADVPVGLHAASEDGDVAHVVAAREEASGAEGGAKSSQVAGVDESSELSVRGEEVDDAGWANGLDGGVLRRGGRGEGHDCVGWLVQRCIFAGMNEL